MFITVKSTDEIPEKLAVDNFSNSFPLKEVIEYSGGCIGILKDGNDYAFLLKDHQDYLKDDDLFDVVKKVLKYATGTVYYASAFIDSNRITDQLRKLSKMGVKIYLLINYPTSESDQRKVAFLISLINAGVKVFYKKGLHFKNCLVINGRYGITINLSGNTNVFGIARNDEDAIVSTLPKVIEKTRKNIEQKIRESTQI